VKQTIYVSLCQEDQDVDFQVLNIPVPEGDPDGDEGYFFGNCVPAEVSIRDAVEKAVREAMQKGHQVLDLSPAQARERFNLASYGEEDFDNFEVELPDPDLKPLPGESPIQALARLALQISGSASELKTVAERLALPSYVQFDLEGPQQRLRGVELPDPDTLDKLSKLPINILELLRAFEALATDILLEQAAQGDEGMGNAEFVQFLEGENPDE